MVLMVLYVLACPQQKVVIIIVVVLILVGLLALIIGLSVGLKHSWTIWIRGELRVSNSGANKLCRATMGVGMKHALEKGLHTLLLCVCVCVFFLSRGLTWGVFVCIWSSWVCVFSLILAVLASGDCSANKAVTEVSYSFSWCLVCGIFSLLMSPAINAIFSLCVSLQRMIIIGAVCAVVVILLIVILSWTLKQDCCFAAIISLSIIHSTPSSIVQRKTHTDHSMWM